MFWSRSALSPRRIIASRCRTWIESATVRKTLRISRQVLREYLVVVTRPQSWSTPLPMADAVEDVRAVGHVVRGS